jgi:hypothetical protein
MKALVKGPNVVRQVEGSVTWRDRIRNYWKFAIVSVGSGLIALDQLTPVFNALHVDKSTTTVAISVGTAFLTLLKGNQQWVDV